VRRQGSKYLHDDLTVLHLLAERGKVHRHAAQAQCIVLDGLTVIECGEVELPRSSPTLMVAIPSQASLAISFFAIIGTISGGTVPHSASSAIISSY
jgi:hypothetical protein